LDPHSFVMERFANLKNCKHKTPEERALLQDLYEDFCFFMIHDSMSNEKLYHGRIWRSLSQQRFEHANPATLNYIDFRVKETDPPRSNLSPLGEPERYIQHQVQETRSSMPM
jgi:hypothetical protein